MNDWPIWIADIDGDDFTMRELAPDTDEYSEAFRVVSDRFQRTLRKFAQEVRAQIAGTAE